MIPFQPLSRPSRRLASAGAALMLTAALTGTLTLATTGCRADAANATTGSTSAPPPAPVARPLLRDLADERSFPAQIEAIERVEISPRVAGAIERVAFTEGATVRRGQLLVQIDPRPFQAALAAAEANAAEAAAALAAATRESERGGRLVARRALAVEDADRRRTIAEAAAARLEAARAAVERARLDLEFTTVRAPIAGRIGRAEVTAGNLVDPDTRLAVLVSTDPVYVRFDVDEATIAAAGSVGDALTSWRVRVSLPGAASAVTHEAEIAFADNEIGQGTGTLRVRARLANPTAAVLPGMFATATLVLAQPRPVLLVRDAAITSDQGRRHVLTVGADGTLAARPVTLGIRQGALRVVTEGLAPDDRVVVNGLFRLRPGMVVTPQEVAMAPEATSDDTTSPAGG